MDSAQLLAFVVDAHEHGYATSEAERDADGGKVIRHSQGDWGYVDRYFGSRAFTGVEVVTHQGSPLWGMHYSGRLRDDADADRIYGFLRDALARVSTDHPFRGPDYTDSGLGYENDTTGALDRFHGQETIRGDGERVYEGWYRGGLLE